MKIFFSAVITFCVLIPHAQITFQKSYGGIYSDAAYSVQQTTDGGYILAGESNSFEGFYDTYLIKTDAEGNTSWIKTFGGTSEDEATGVKQTSDGGFIITGTTYNGFGKTIYLIKTNAGGDTLWTKNYIGGNGFHTGKSVLQASDNGYIISGSTPNLGVAAGGASDIYLIRTDEVGDTLWTRSYGGVAEEAGNSVQQNGDDGFILGGTTASFGVGQTDLYLVKTDASGDTVFSRTYGGIESEFGGYAKQTSDNGFIILGHTFSFGEGASDFYLVRTDANGDTLWTRTYGGAGTDIAYGIDQSDDGGFIMAGLTNSFGSGSLDAYLIKTDAAGEVEFSKTFGGLGEDSAYDFQKTNDGGYVLTGLTISFGATGFDVYLIKTDAQGNSGCNQTNASTLTGTTFTQVTEPATSVFSGGAVPIALIAQGTGGKEHTICTGIDVSEVVEAPSMSIYPNPFNDHLTISGTSTKGALTVFDLCGKLIFSQNAFSGQSRIDTATLRPGFYLVNYREGAFSKNFKVQTE